ncbi:Transketolase 1 [Candidatus Hartigia pinicola]|nr:Transketolase 1 [Candidatus Hartigia pinicola]
MKARKTLANAIRFLSIDAIQQAKSGHPGAPMGMADIAEVLWREYMNHNPANPIWINRDRFVLSNGHGSMLLYSILHLTGYDLSLDELKNFRQLNFKTPGHPEYNHTLGVETTTGPLGQGIANAVGFAIAERTLAAQFNRPGHSIIDHHTYVFMGDGCMMEGISHEVCSLAGTLQLNKLIVFYDDNGISIDGHVQGWFTDDTATRFEAYGWHVIRNIDGHNTDQIHEAVTTAHNEINKPTLIICKTIIGFGSPNKSGTESIHGAPLGDSEIIATREALGWKFSPFEIPQEIYQAWSARETGKEKEKKWNEKFAVYTKTFPDLSKEFTRRILRKLPSNFDKQSKKFIQYLQENPTNISSRQASQNTLEVFGKILPELMGGSADLSPSNLTMWSGSKPINQNKIGNYIHYGVREFGMSAIMNGLALYGGFIPYGATFLIFLEYARNAVRMAAIMNIRSIFVYTHDSIGLGEDGPTHQPVEQLASLRTTPNIHTWRPCDQVESAIAWKSAIERKDGPTALIFSRQNLEQQPRTTQQITDIYKGAYILKDCENEPELIYIATGSEVTLAIKSAEKLSAEGYKVRVISMPSTEVFDTQDEIYRETVLPSQVTKRIAIEASITDYWFKYTGLHGVIIGMNSFGKSAPAEDLFIEFGITVENIVLAAKLLLKSSN